MAIQLHKDDGLQEPQTSTVNSRPLTYVYADQPSTSGQPLTPANFLLSRSAVSPPTTSADDHESDSEYLPGVPSSAEQLLQIWKKGQKLLDHFQREYLLSLRERRPSSATNGHAATASLPSVGDVVLLMGLRQEGARHWSCDTRENIEGAWTGGRQDSGECTTEGRKSKGRSDSLELRPLASTPFRRKDKKARMYGTTMQTVDLRTVDPFCFTQNFV